MKKYFFVIAMSVYVLTGIQAQNSRNFETSPLEQIQKEWSSVPIKNVVNGSLGIMLEAFDRTWPTYVVGDARSVMEQGLSEKMLDKETGYKVINDAQNGYVEVSDYGTDGMYMSACVWNRSNGHKLFAVCLGQPTDPCLDFVCFYDYDQQTKMMTPVTDVYKGFARWTVDGQMMHKLPRQGKDMVIYEYGYPQCYVHEFTWNGMKPVYKQTRADNSILKDSESEDYVTGVTVKFSGSQPNIKDFMNTILSQEDIGEALGAVSQSWEWYRNGMNMLDGQSFIVDVDNGYIGFNEDISDQERLYVEFCYWNYADGKHKLVAENVVNIVDGKPVEGQYAGISYLKYDNDTHKMICVDANSLGIDMEMPVGEYSSLRRLPRKGKTIEYEFYLPAGKITKRYTWNGSRFVKE